MASDIPGPIALSLHPFTVRNSRQLRSSGHHLANNATNYFNQAARPSLAGRYHRDGNFTLDRNGRLAIRSGNLSTAPGPDVT